MAGKNQPEIQLPYLETFCQAAECNSFTAVGKDQGISQAAVSQRIHALEARLRIALFARKGGRIELTDAGRILYYHAQRILSLHREAVEEITGQKTPVRGELLLGASSVPGEHLLPGALSIFRQQYPDVHVRASVLDSLAVVEQVRRGKVCLGMVGRKDDNACLEFRPFASDEIILLVPPDHTWRRRKQVALKQFSKQPIIVREPGSGSRWCLEQSLFAGGTSLSELNIVMELGSNESIKEAVLKGMGVAALSALAVQKEVASRHLHAVRISDMPIERTMYVVWNNQRVLPAPARAFLRFLERCPGIDFRP